MRGFVVHDVWMAESPVSMYARAPCIRMARRRRTHMSIGGKGDGGDNVV